jgi:hypothetical protein
MTKLDARPPTEPKVEGSYHSEDKHFIVDEKVTRAP